MSNISKCSIIIYDDFNNILICKKGKLKNEHNIPWILFGKELKGKETEEKCITKAVDKSDVEDLQIDSLDKKIIIDFFNKI